MLFGKNVLPTPSMGTLSSFGMLTNILSLESFDLMRACFLYATCYVAPESITHDVAKLILLAMFTSGCCD